jgi:D-3-phosphoglycerate dehydrogenase
MKILLASPIDPGTVRVLSESHDVVKPAAPTPEALKEAIADRDAVVLRSGVMLSADVLAAAPGLKLLVRAGAGLDNIDLGQARSQGLRVVKIPGMSAPPVAEFTFALLLSLARRVTVADRLLRDGHWPKPTLGGPLLHGKTLGIVGAGNIGALVGQMGAAWGMRAIGCVANSNDTVAQQLLGRGVRLTDFDEVLTTSDFLCLHTPLDESTRHLIGTEALSRMKPGSLLVNVARGGVVDEAALLEALTRGDTVAGAALDVHEIEGEGTMSRFSELDNVVLTPHIGAMAVDSQRLIGERIVELVQAYDNGKLDEEIRDGEHVL